MVLRKPVGDAAMVPQPLHQAANNPPYPTTPTTEAPPPLPPGDPPAPPSQPTDPTASFEVIGREDAPKVEGVALPDQNDSDSDEWDKDDTEDEEEEQKGPDANAIPASLKVGGSKEGSRDVSPRLQPAAPSTSIPDSLRVGPPEGVPLLPEESSVSQHSTTSNPWTAMNQRQPSQPLQSNNPFLRMQISGQSSQTLSSSSVWADDLAGLAPVELPAHQTPTDAFSTMSLSDGVDHEPSTPFSKQAPLISVEAENEAERLFHGAPPIPTSQPPVPPIQELSQTSQPLQPQAQPSSSVWDGQLRTNEATAKELAHMGQVQEANPWTDGEPAPKLPPRPVDAEAPPQPPRPQGGIPATSAPPRSTQESPNAMVDRQRKEHYAIKHIRWFDDAAGKLRESPILIQNANGPCPLLALVNALVLSTPLKSETALIETLRTREQVSLGLLLDAVFDELMSGRRGDAAQELPDVGELYQFLLALHTGMNVNPRFVPPAEEAPNLMDLDGPITDVPSTKRQPGGFEQTREMRLYSTFNVPLIHGWLPSNSSEAYNAFERAAKTFEDAQNVQFREEELDEKLRTSGLSPEEINLFEDITSIKEFLNRWPTQLTDYGLGVLKEYLRPGSIAIFFRNDHFSTLYKEPKGGKLMALVTDAGYTSHEEIVWESLVDVNGRNGELFSGDFRPVGGASVPGSVPTFGATASSGPAGPRTSSTRPVRSMLNVDGSGGDAWASNTGRRRNNDSTSLQGHTRDDSGIAMNQVTGVVNSSASQTREEQEDHDLALALQLQEEEEDRARRESRREQEDRLSQNYLDGAGRAGPAGQDVRPLIPPRRNQAPTQATTTSEAAEDAPPPSYEQASRRPAYHPPRDHPASPLAPISSSGNGRGAAAARNRRNSGTNTDTAYGTNNLQQTGRRRTSANHVPGRYPTGTGRGRGNTQYQYGGIGQGYTQQVGDDRDKCVVM